MVKRISILCLACCCFSLYSFYGQPQGAGGFSRGTAHASYPDCRIVRRHRLFHRDLGRHGTRRLEFSGGGRSVVPPDFRHEPPVGWYIMSPEVKHEVGGHAGRGAPGA